MPVRAALQHFASMPADPVFWSCSARVCARFGSCKHYRGRQYRQQCARDCRAVQRNHRGRSGDGVSSCTHAADARVQQHHWRHKNAADRAARHEFNRVVSKALCKSTIGRLRGSTAPQRNRKMLPVRAFCSTDERKLDGCVNGQANHSHVVQQSKKHDTEDN